MPLEPEAVSRRDLALEDLEGLELELHDLAAAATNQVVVVFAPHRHLVAPSFSSSDGMLKYSSLNQQWQYAIDGCLGAADPARFEIRREILDREMARVLQHGLDNGPAGCREPESPAREKSFEPHHRLRDRRIGMVGLGR